MTIKKYLKDQSAVILLYLSSILLVTLIFVLDMLQETIEIKSATIIYVIFISLMMLIVYLSYDYLKVRKDYQILQTMIIQEDPDLLMRLAGRKEHTKLYKQSLDIYYRQNEEALKEFERKEKMNETFQNIWIHQMKTPISVLNLMLEEKDTCRQDRLSMLEEVKKLENGLELALYNLRIKDFNIDYKITKVNLGKLIREVVSENKHLFIMNHIYPEVSCSDDLFIYTDTKWFSFVLKQLIQNSIKYTKVKDSDYKTVKIICEKKQGGISLIVYDNGIGIALSDQQRIFDPFYTGENGRKYAESTGMGLYLTKQICDQLSCELNVNSAPQGFTQVEIFIKTPDQIFHLT